MTFPSPAHPSPTDRFGRLLTPFTVLCLVLALRVVHLLSALRSPLTYQIGPDEDFYRRFGLDVAFGSGGMTPEFGFMDPLYGYLLGATIKLGGSVFPMYLLQVAVDVGTAYALILIARELCRPRIGLLAALIYALLGPAMAFPVMLLKTTWVTGYVTWWIWLALRTFRSDRVLAWAGFGLYCGLGVALRANLILLSGLALLLIPWLQWRNQPVRVLVQRSSLLLLGLALPLALLVARNVALADRWSPVPSNGGVVLHQLYNLENPRSLSGAPSFVRYGHPSEIRRAYVTEAERRAGHPLTAQQVDDYWRRQARDYLLSHPGQSLRNALRKLGEFSAYPEVPNNRSYQDERRFSPLLRVLPQPFGWLFALGVPGLLLLVYRDRRGWLVLAPVAMGLATIAVFFAEDRFRFNIVTPFVLGSALWLAWLLGLARTRRWRALLASVALSALLGAFSLWQAQRIAPTPMDWQRIANGYIRMGERIDARRFLNEVERDQPNAIGLHELRGVMAVQDQDYPLARRELEAAIAQRQDRHEVWHNYSLVLEHEGETELALAAEARAEALSPLPDYQFRMATLLEQLGRNADAARIYDVLVQNPPSQSDGKAWAAQAAARLRAISPPVR
ncbi:MAG: tetratricopeptide repeat protein [Pseudoxanthomonas sp.]